ncbi:MAG: hypothetical protein RBT36_02225 [Desulfobulbus sp.]|nr:hypothetical protein [Desulfobulbus sp.]
MRHHKFTTIRTLHCTFLTLLLVALLCGPLPATQALASVENDFSGQQTVEIFQTIPGLSDQQLEQGRAVIGSMHYNAQRVFRKICALPGVTFEQALQVADRLQRERFTFEQVQAFETFSSLPGVDIDTGLAGLDAVRTLSFSSSRAFRSYTGISGVTGTQALAAIPLLNNLDEAHLKGAQALFAVQGMQVGTAHKSLNLLNRMRTNQARAVETFAGVPGMDTSTLLSGMEIIQKLRSEDAWNAHWLFTDKSLAPQEAWDWLISYFTLPGSAQETRYDKLTSRQKTILLKGLYGGGEEIVWKINNLHAVSDHNGYEFPAAVLNGFSRQRLQELFNRLAPSVQSRFRGQFAASGGGAVGVLRQATSAGRVQAARDLTTANAYAVMAQGSDLYDSSFRDILVPVMQERVNRRSNGDLLHFLKDIDPENQLVSDFIVSCAQKGKLTVFFPTDAHKQKEIINLVAASAFRDEDSILLFSATLSHLLKVLAPDARSHLITLMARQTESGHAVFSKLITVILQYYLQTYPELLGPTDRHLISRLLVRNGAVNLEKYQVTPFAEWKRDGRLGSVSMFHPDDDGRQSFASNGNLLLKNGYRLSASRQYTPRGATAGLEQEVQRYGAAGLSSLFSAMRQRHFAVAFSKQVNGITIVHTQFVYTDKTNQTEMLRRFIKAGDEMLAQRGHSYWRSEQIIEPLTDLLKENKITESDLRAKQRFLSLGSCGGLKVYTGLTRLFSGSVDILATIGTGLALINDPYNKSFFEIIAANPSSISWKTVARETSFIFQGGWGQDYLQPGSLTAILHKILDESRQAAGAATGTQPAGRQG